jgi:hypothetical protein
MTAQASNVARNVVLSCRLLPESVGTLGLGSSCCRSIPAWNHFGFEKFERGKKQMPCVCPKLTDETCLKDGSCAPKASFRVFLRQTGSGSGLEPFWSGPTMHQNCIRIVIQERNNRQQCHDATMPRCHGLPGSWHLGGPAVWFLPTGSAFDLGWLRMT